MPVSHAPTLALVANTSPPPPQSPSPMDPLESSFATDEVIALLSAHCIASISTANDSNHSPSGKSGSTPPFWQLTCRLLVDLRDFLAAWPENVLDQVSFYRWAHKQARDMKWNVLEERRALIELTRTEASTMLARCFEHKVQAIDLINQKSLWSITFTPRSYLQSWVDLVTRLDGICAGLRAQADFYMFLLEGKEPLAAATCN